MMSSRISRSIVHLFHPKQHLWLRAFPSSLPPAESSASRSIGIEMGLTERGLEEIGDVIALRRYFQSSSNEPEQQKVKAGENILAIDFEGHSITNADELYHTVWETFEGTKVIKSPIDGIVEDIHLGDTLLDEESILVRLQTSLDVLERATSKDILMKELDYARVLKTLSPGMFGDA